MSTAANKKKKSDEIDAILDTALESTPRDAKVPISLRLDGDIYNELNRRAKLGEAKGKYQSLLNDLLRESLFKITVNQRQKNKAILEMWNHHETMKLAEQVAEQAIIKFNRSAVVSSRIHAKSATVKMSRLSTKKR